MGAIDHRQVEELRDAFERHEVKYLFIGKTGAILHGFPDTTQDADLFVQKTVRNGAAAARALQELGFDLTAEQRAEIRRGKDFVQLKNGPFDVDLVFAPDGIERFEDAWRRGADIDGFPVCSIDDIIASKRASNRAKERSGRFPLPGGKIQPGATPAAGVHSGTPAGATNQTICGGRSGLLNRELHRFAKASGAINTGGKPFPRCPPRVSTKRGRLGGHAKLACWSGKAGL